jgi:hypothetical protein
MAAHHTKDKGDLGVAKAHADLVSQGCTVLFPATEHAPFDLVAYREGKFSRVQVKYRAVRRGSVKVELRSVWNDRHGRHVVPLNRSEVDVLCIYCPDTDECYYVSPQDCKAEVTLRVFPAKNRQQVVVRPASELRRMPV